ncbi:MAG: hypothetical protein ACRC5R_05450 [Mycoplasmatales bacterium]
MNNQRDYFCKKISEIKNTNMYLSYLFEFEKLKYNTEYNLLLENVSKKNPNYLNDKIKIKKMEKDVKIYEREINSYLKYILDKYNNLIYEN